MSFVKAAEVGEITEDVPLGVSVEDHDLVLVKQAGEVYALRDECSHAQVLLSQGDVGEHCIECYYHGSRFDLSTGEALNLPATDPVPVYPVRVDGDDVLVDVDSPSIPEEF